MTTYRSHYAADLGGESSGDEVRVAGWVVRVRDLGGILFFELRDSSGRVQIVIDPEQIPEGSELRMEYCVSIRGAVRLRPGGTENLDLDTGMIEIAAAELEILSTADVLPFMVDDRTEADERVRLEYRYLDLRRPRMAANVRARAIGLASMRETLNELGFLDVETPTLINSTPEGARDFLVPSRLRPGHFYALPQSPQLFKQLLMISGVDRYYQIARCYRDEDLRSDRQLEFTQLDLEGAFWDQDDVLATIEHVVVATARRLRGIDVPAPFARLTYADAMARFGTDKPDMRFGMEISDISDVFQSTEFRGFAGVLDAGGVVRGLNAGAMDMTRAQLDGLVDRAKELGGAGLVWIVVQEDGTFRSPVAKFFSEEERAGIVESLDASPGDVLTIVADQATTAAKILGVVRLDLGQPHGHEALHFVWVVDFPVFEESADGELAPVHHPFTAPVSVEEMRDNPATAISRSYDLVLNGSELGSGSVRIHDPDVQQAVFDVLGISKEDAASRFGWFVRALRYGTPPHAGFAIGVDRLFAILQEENSIRDVIPFPKTQTGGDPLTTAPTLVDASQLAELGIDLTAATKLQLAAQLSDEGGGEPNA